MSIFNDDERGRLASELRRPAYAGLDAGEKCEALNAPTRAETPRKAPRPFDRADVLGKLSYASRRRVMVLAIAGRILDAINAQDRRAVAEYADSLRGDPEGPDDGEITRDELAAILGVLAATDDAVEVEYGPSRFQELFGDAAFEIPSGPGAVAVVSGTCLPAMIEEAEAHG